MTQTLPKIEGTCKDWWISSLFSNVGEVSLNGSFYGLESIGYKEGEFDVVLIEKLDLINEIVESNSAFIKLVQPATVDGMLEKMNNVETNIRKGPISKPPKKEGGN